MGSEMCIRDRTGPRGHGGDYLGVVGAELRAHAVGEVQRLARGPLVVDSPDRVDDEAVGGRVVHGIPLRTRHLVIELSLIHISEPTRPY